MVITLGTESSNYFNDPRLEWVAERIKSCLYGISNESIADIYTNEAYAEIIIGVFEKKNERFFTIYFQDSSLNGNETLTKDSFETRKKSFSKLVVTTRPIPNTNITGSVNYPPDRTRCVFFVCVDDVELTWEVVQNWRTDPNCPIHRAFEISSMVVPSLDSFYMILRHAYKPIVEDVTRCAERGRTIAKKRLANRQLYTEILNWVLRVDMHMSGFLNQVCAERRLPMPQSLVSLGSADSGMKSALANEDVIKQIDTTVAQWQAEISYAMSLDPQKEGPLGEIEYWREKYSTISALYEQINLPKAKFILKVAKEAECNSFHIISTTLQQFFRLYAEAKDNVKFLGTLDRHFRTLHGITPGSGSLQPIIDTLSSMMTGIRMVWIISRYYCTEERMVGLLEKVGKLIAQKVSQHIDFRSILSLPFSEAKNKVVEGQQCLLKWKSTYTNVQEEISNSEREQPWNFNQKRLFETTDYMSDRCTDLLEIIETVEYYTMVLGAQLKTVLTDTSGIERILKDVEKVKRPFETLTFDIFERKATHNWQVVYSNFVNTVAHLDHEVSDFINKIFDDDLRSAESAFELLLSFKAIASRPQRLGDVFNTASLLSEKADRILVQYFSEVERVRKIFIENCDNPPLTKNQPPVAGAIHWSTSLFQRLKKPIVRFHQEGMLLTQMGRQVRAKYVEVARQMKEYATSRFVNWSDSVRQVTTASLKLPILRKSSDDTYVTNFNPALFDIIREAKYLDCLGFDVPQEAVNVTLQDESYHANVDALKAMLLSFNCELQGALDGPERVILAKNIRELKLALEPGFNDINWTSLGIPDFVLNCERAITKFRNLSREVRKRADHIQTQVVNKIGSTKLIPEFEQLLQAGGELPELQVLVDTVERRRSELIDTCLRAFRTAKPLLTKVESQLVGTHTGKCLVLESYYNHWELRILKALTKMVLSSLVAFAKLLGYRGTSSASSAQKAKRPPLFKVLIFLTTEPTYSPPQQEITTAFHKVQSSIIESTRKFKRWMRGTCIEFTQGELVPRPSEGEYETLFTYYQEISSLPQVYRLQALINRTIQTHLSALATNIKMLQRYRFIYLADKKLSVEQQAKSQFHWIDYDAKFQLYFNMIADFDAEDHIHDFGFMRCDETAFFAELVEHVYQWIAMEGAQMNDAVRVRMQNRLSRIIRINKDLQKPCENIDDLKFVLEVMHNARASSINVEQDINDIKYTYESIMQFGIKVDPHEFKEALSLGDLWECTLARLHKLQEDLEPKKDRFRDFTRAEVERFLKSAETVLKEFQKNGPGQAGIDLQEGNNLKKQWREQLTQLQTKRDQLTKAEKLFDLPLTSHTHLQQLNEELTKIELVYDLYEQWAAILKRWNRSSWKDILLEDLQSTTEEKVKRARILGRTHGDVEPFSDVQQVILNFHSSLPLLAKLKSPALKQRHWLELMRITGKDFSIEQVSLNDFISMELYRFTDAIDGIVLAAAREQAVEKDIFSVKEFWSKAEFLLVPYEPRKGDVRCNILSDTSEIQDAVDDNILKMQSIANLKWAQPFIDDVKMWEKRLLTINDVIAVWVVVQMKWQYLESIFRGSDDIANQLPKESAKFNDLDKKFVRIMNETTATQNVDVSCNVTGRLEEFRHLEEKLEECQKDLSNYLETKRRVFPRFYFISDDELLSILAASSAKAVEDHMLKMFDNCARLIFKGDEEEEVICGLESQEGEVVNLEHPLSASAAPVEVWLQSLLDESRSSLRDILKAGVYYYPRMKRLEWVQKYHGMVTLTGAKVWWTFGVENAFDAFKKGKKNAVKELLGQLSRQLIDLVGEMDKDVERNYAQKINTLIIVDVHGRDIVNRFVRDSVTDVSEFDWESQLRFYWEREHDTCIIRQCTGRFVYGYEYMGLNGRLVITPLTDRCFMTLTQALSFFLGGAPGGPAGTGKTESVKDLAKALAIHCVVFNCGEGLDYKAMNTIFSGLSQSGSWGCFDEFNRIELPVLSVVSEQLRSIQTALKLGSKEFFFGDTTIRLVPTVGVFITMNPGYAGRVELPDNLKALFRPVVMVVPDMELIAENMLFSQGFTTAGELARKMVTLYDLAKGQLSKQHHYDWGLRALKAVLVMAGKLKRGSPELSEESVLMRALRDMNAPKFIAEDEPLFKGLIGDLFPGLDPTRAPQENLSRAATKVFKEKGFYVDAKQIDKVVQLYETMQTRHTSMVVGPTGGGKSTVIDCLCRSQTDLGLPTKVYLINPKAQPTTALYGVMDPLTRSWTDGIFSSIFRAINRPGEGSERERRYVVFDGDVDAKWVEDMNSVMDDNKLLTLPNGERIRLLPSSSLLFEVGDLQYASPATVSRVGMVFFDPVNLGWQPFMYYWKLRRPRDELDTFNELIEKYLNHLVSFMFHGIDGNVVTNPPKLVIPTNELNMVRQLTTMLHTVSPQNVALEPKALQCVFLFCCVWSFGALIATAEDRLRFDKFLKKISGWNLQDVGDNFLTRFVGSGSLPERKTLYDYYFDLTDNRWKPWHILVRPFDWPAGAKFNSLLVSTVDTERNMWLLNKIVLNRTPVMLVGESGTAKTVTIHAYLRDLKMRSLDANVFADEDVHLEEMLLEMNFSSRTTSLDAQRAMEDNIEKRTNTVLGPPAKKRLIVFVDDINMPRVDLYGTQQPIAFLKLLIEHFSWYDRKDLLFKNVRDTQFVAAMAPPGGGRNALDPRFVSLFTAFNILFPSDESITTIYGQILNAVYKPMGHPGITELPTLLTSMTFNLYERLFLALPATPTKFHYIFNLRDLSRVYEGLCRATPQKFFEVQHILRLWRNEFTRVFVDRMADEADKKFVGELIQAEVEKHFPETLDYIMADPLLFGDFGDFEPDSDFQRLHIYEDFGAEYTRARCLVETILEEINTPTKKMDLVMFDMALDHLLRITRVISLPRGNCLLIGVGGGGKQSLTRLAANICEMGMFEIVLSRNYNEESFREDLKRLYTRVGVQEEKVVFLFTDGHVKEEGFLELINNMLASGMVPALFSEEEKEPLYNSVVAQVEASGLALSKDNKWTAFVSRCRDNLHVVLSMSPSGDALRTRCRSFPSLINNTTIDWFQKWPSQALEAVGKRMLQSEDLPEELKPAIASHAVYVHKTADKLSMRYLNELKRHNYVTPKNFLGFLANYSKLLITRREEIDDLVEKFAVGLNKLDHAQEDVRVLQEELAEKEVSLSEKQQINERMTNEIKEQKERNEKRKAEALVMEESLNVQSAEIEKESAEAQVVLDLAMPALEEAMEAVKHINPKSITELKSFAKPHASVVAVVCMVCVVKGVPATWESGKIMMGQSDFIRSLIDIDSLAPTLNQSKINEINKINKEYNVESSTLRKISLAASGLMIWVEAMKAYWDTAKEVLPKQARVRELRAAKENAERQLNACQEEIEQLTVSLQRLQEQLDAGMNEARQLQKEKAVMERRLNAAHRLLDGFGSERVRWAEQKRVLADVRNKLVGDCLAGAAFFSYLGAFTFQYRQEALETLWLKDISERKIPLTADFNIQRLLTDEVSISQWASDGLPSDALSIQNGILTTMSTQPLGRGKRAGCVRFPLCIDPQMQAVNWIKRQHKSNPRFESASLNDSDFLKRLEFAIQYGNPFLFEGVDEFIDPILDSVLDPQFHEDSGQRIIRIGEKNIVWDPNFKLYLCTKLPNPEYAAEVFGKTIVINYAVTEDGLESQLLNYVVASERSDLQRQSEELVQTMAESCAQLKELEDTLIRELTLATGNILDNDDLIATLENTKNSAVEVQQKLEQAKETARITEISRQEYRLAARRGAVLYFVISELSAINSMYGYSLSAFLHDVFGYSITKSDASFEIKDRLNNIIRALTYNLYCYVCMGIFEKDKLMLSFQIAIRLLRQENRLDCGELEFFLRGCVLASKDYPPNPVDWLTERQWNDICKLATTSKVFENLCNDILENKDKWREWSALDKPEDLSNPIPCGYNERISEFQLLCLLRCFRGDRVYTAVTNFISNCDLLGEQYVSPPILRYKDVLDKSSATAPIVCIVSPGANPTDEIIKLATKEVGIQKLRSISLGQGQGEEAMKLVEVGTVRGHWVLLQNCHLLTKWMKELEKVIEKMDQTQPQEEFRLWLTTEPSRDFPMGILQRSLKVVNEPPNGLKMNIKNTLSKVTEDQLESCSHSAFRSLVFTLAFFHAVVQERRKYGKIGWNVVYDFNETDFSVSMKLLDTYMTKAYNNNGAIPWDTLRYLVGEAMYGGRVTDNMDRRIVKTYLEEYFGDFLFDTFQTFYFYKSDDVSYSLPAEGGELNKRATLQQMLSLVDTFPKDNSPEVFGLHANAETGYLRNAAEVMWASLIELMPSSEGTSVRSGRSREEVVLKLAEDILSQIPEPMDRKQIMRKEKERAQERGHNSLQPTQVVLLQEIERWNRLVVAMVTSLEELQKALSGTIGMSSELDNLASSLHNGQLPGSWRRLAPATRKNLGRWLAHFQRRYAQYNDWATNGEPKCVWLSGLMVPESYISALVQVVCRRYRWPLDRSTVVTRVTEYITPQDVPARPNDGAYVTGIFIEGARWDASRGRLAPQIKKQLTSEMPVMHIIPTELSKVRSVSVFKTPVYVTSDRRNAAGVGLVFEADLTTDEHSSLWTLASVALVLDSDD